MYMNRGMSEQHKFIYKIKMFCENRFDIVIIGKDKDKNKMIGNMFFKCFLDPLGKTIIDHIGEEYAEGRAEANLTLNLDSSEETRLIKEILSIKEDKIRYTQIKVVKIYGLGLRIHVAGRIDKSEKFALTVASQQIHVMANYLNFKKRYKSGFGMNSFLLILDYDGKMTLQINCMIELLTSLFTTSVFSSLIFMIETEEKDQNVLKNLVEEAKFNISQKACCKPEIIEVLTIKLNAITDDAVVPLPTQENQDQEEDCDDTEETPVSATLKICNAIARQVYIDPNPFEPEGMDHHDALSVIETIKKKYQPKDKDWCEIINHIYTMVPN